MNKKVVMAIAAGILVPVMMAQPVHAGFLIQEIDPEFPEDATTTWFQGGLARVDGALEGLSVIVDVKNGEGWLIDKAARRYAGGKIDELAAEIRKLEGAQAEDAGSEGAGGTQPPDQPAKPLAVQIKEMGAGERLQGYETRRAQVLVEGELLEELWLAPKLEVVREVDLAAFGSAIQRMLGGGAGLNQGYEESDVYRKLRSTGYPLRQVLYFVGEKSTIEVTSIVIKDLSPSDFTVPTGFSKVGYTELLLDEVK